MGIPTPTHAVSDLEMLYEGGIFEFVGSMSFLGCAFSDGSFAGRHS